MLEKVVSKIDYFLDVEEEVSSTGYYPKRGLYTRLELSSGVIVWLDGKGQNIQLDRWCRQLNNMSKYESK